MADLKLNETPIRTAKNYKINNIKLPAKKESVVGKITVKEKVHPDLTD